LAKFAIVHPDAAGVIPFGPVSWYGVARPCAVSGFAGTTMSQLTLAAAAAAAGAVAVAAGLAAALAAADALALGLAVAPAADCWMVVLDGPPVNARTAPSVRPNAIGMARGTAMRAARLCGRRRHAGLWPVRIQSTSMMMMSR
jgi:hypothetical protein